MKRLVLTFAVTTAVTVAIVLALHLVDVRLNLAYALVFVLGALLVRELNAAGFGGSTPPEFPRALYRATPELEAAKDRRVRRIEDDLFRTIETKRQGPRLPATYLHKIARELETLAAMRGENLALSQQTSDLIALAHEAGSPTDSPRSQGPRVRLTRRALVAALRDLEHEYTRLTAPATHAKERP
ncbi:hypothetical protein [Dermabacter vaginalis]|uniref:5-bromo-4-chloroindolyl phosphate hydrolysis protein n=1 Tax=Dermabacter vaginalis TaxID=1630135 RepID=A0ABX6A3G7_9MICO|nr:hypothetical protein [Dermabacter vaginalis]QEU11736.1 hypothetical protein FOB48_05120 [Dermabacter vaginalis]